MTHIKSTIFHATILSIFPEMFPGTLCYSLAGSALAKNIWSYETVNIRNFGISKHRNVDDEPYGGGNGLVMRPDVLGNAIDFARMRHPHAKIYYMSPRGIPLDQKLVSKISTEKDIIILCGRFEGIDERVMLEYSATEVSVGDFVLSGGEAAAICLLDSCIRLLPGVLQNQSTLLEESFGEINGLEYPLYTRPQMWRSHSVPDVLLSGNHQEIEKWRKHQSLQITTQRRPDLLLRKEK